MQMQINVMFDLGTASGRSEFQKLFQNLFPPGGELLAHPSSVPDNPDRAAAALAGRQAAAAKARAAKAAKQAPSEITHHGSEPDDVAGPPANGGDLGDQLVGDDPDDMGLVDPSMSPEEAKEAGIALVRQMYIASKTAEVKALQKKYQIVKFTDLPVSEAHAFYREVLGISHRVMGPQA